MFPSWSYGRHHPSITGLLCSPDVAPETYLKQPAGQPLQMYWCQQERSSVFAIPGTHRTLMTQTTNALHSYTKSTHKHVLTLLYTSVFLKLWFSDLLHQNPLVSILKIHILEIHSEAVESEYSQNNSFKYSISYYTQ